MRKYYSIELTREDADKLKKYLHEGGYVFETSGVGSLVHFETLLSPDELSLVNDWIDTNL